jgi:hypothetical protein
MKDLERYYPSTHIMFASFNFLLSYYLIQNEKYSEVIECLNKTLTNPYFSQNKDFLGMVYALLIMAYIQSGNIDLVQI